MEVYVARIQVISTDEVEFNINPQYIKNSGISFAGVELNEFQKVLLFMNKTDDDIDNLKEKLKVNGLVLETDRIKKLIKENTIKEDVVFIHSPTGTGKTFGFLLPTVSSSISNISGRIKTVITEPTNSIISEINHDISEESKKMKEQINYTMMTGQNKTKNRIIEIPEIMSKNDVVITNIDIISLYVAGRYLNRWRLSPEKAIQWSDMFKKISLFIIDEYHSYDEESLAKIVSLILISKYTGNEVKFIFSSATPNKKFIEILKLYKIDFKDITIGSELNVENSRKFRGNIRLIFTSKELQNESISSQSNKKIMYMFDHKIDAEEFIYKLKDNNIYPRELTGYNTRKIGGIVQEVNSNIIVATNAGELGVNINPDIEHIEPGMYLENFWQRLGRAGRGKDATIYVHINEKELKLFNDVNTGESNYNLAIEQISDRLSLNNKIFIAKKCKLYLSGFLYAIYEKAGNYDLKNQIMNISKVVSMYHFFNLKKVIDLVNQDPEIKDPYKNEIKKFVNIIITNLGYFRGTTNNVIVELPDGKRTSEDYAYMKIHTEYKIKCGVYKIERFLKNPQKVNICYDGLGHIPVCIEKSEIYNKIKFADKFKLNISDFLEDYTNGAKYLKLMEILYEPDFISTKVLIPKEVYAENDDNIFL